MAPSRRRPRSPVQRPRQRLSSLFFGIGCLVVLVVSFTLGVAAGRRWPTGVALPGLGGLATTTAAARAEREAKRSETRGLDRDKAKLEAEPTAPLSFYHELTAPLTAPPPAARPAAKPARAEAKATEAPRPAPRPSESRKSPETAAPPELPPRDRQPPAPAAGGGEAASPGTSRFTVQVGSFKVRAQAETLRARLAESGQEAYVNEVEVGGSLQYRVRVGSFATREAARDAATRLGSEQRVTTYVTTR